MKEEQSRKPIVFKSEVQTHFADFDQYGHLSSSHYINYLWTHRFNCLEKISSMTPHDFVKKGFGFYCTNININYKLPVRPVQKTIYFESYVTDYKKISFEVIFSIFNNPGGKLHADGSFTIHNIDMSTNKPCELPLWAQEFFWE